MENSHFVVGGVLLLLLSSTSRYQTVTRDDLPREDGIWAPVSSCFPEEVNNLTTACFSDLSSSRMNRSTRSTANPPEEDRNWKASLRKEGLESRRGLRSRVRRVLAGLVEVEILEPVLERERFFPGGVPMLLEGDFLCLGLGGRGRKKGLRWRGEGFLLRGMS